MMDNRIKRMLELVEYHTHLTDVDKEVISNLIQQIEITELHPNFDVFIDVLDSQKKSAIVVYQRPNLTDEPLYSSDLTGELINLENEPAVMRTMQIGLASKGVHATSPGGRDISQTVFPIHSEKEVVGALILESSLISNIVEKLPYAFDESSKKILEHDALNDFYNQLDHAAIIYDDMGYVSIANEPAKSLYRSIGYQNSIEGMHYDNISLDFATYEYMRYLFEVKKEQSQQHESRYLDYYLSTKIIWLPDTKRILVFINDVTKEKEQEQNIKKKSLIIQEIHHRIKNNLQTIVSLLKLQERRSQNAETKKALRESSARVLSIATTHQLLSQEIDGNVSLVDTVTSLTKNLQNLLTTKSDIEIRIEIDKSIVLYSEQLVALSLILNELLSNAYEHAFKDKDKGIIIIKANQFQNKLTLVIKDNGEGYDVEQVESSLGLKIASMYVSEALEGTLLTKSDVDGTMNKIEFTIDEE
ncbi:histidine kinase N-terminal domain-containing protein [Vagococcus carniphilus]